MKLKYGCFLYIFLLFGCNKNQIYLDANPNSQTYHDLVTLAYIAALVEINGFPIEECKSIKEILYQASIIGIGEAINYYEANSFSEDRWGEKYRLFVFRDKLQITLRISSNGANGFFENGGGDDLFAEIIFRPNYGNPYIKARDNRGGIKTFFVPFDP